MTAPARDVVCAEAVQWLRTHEAVADRAIVTSLPDVSEVGMSLAAWRTWFLDAVLAVVNATTPAQPAIFFQTDIKRDGHWIDKGALVVRAAEDAGAHVLFHKVVCRRPPGTNTYGRPAFTHLIAVSRELKCPAVLAVPDIIVDAGRLPWVRAMGVRAAGHAVRFARDHAAAKSILDPFCGVGTVLAAANLLGLDAVGVERSRQRCARARVLAVTPDDVAV